MNSKRICLVHNRCGVGKENRIQWNGSMTIKKKKGILLFTRFYSLVSYLLGYLSCGGHHCLFTNIEKKRGEKKKEEGMGKGWTFPNKEIKDKKKGRVLMKEWKRVNVFMILFGSERVSWRQVKFWRRKMDWVRLRRGCT